MSRKQNTTGSHDADLAAWCAALVPNEVDEIPEGWFTAIELGKMLGKDRSTITALMQTALREGRAEVRKFRVMTGRGAYPVPHYRLK